MFRELLGVLMAAQTKIMVLLINAGRWTNRAVFDS